MAGAVKARAFTLPIVARSDLLTAAYNVPGFSETGGVLKNNQRRSLLAPNWKSWIDGEVEFNGEKVKAMIVVHWWNGWEMRKSYLEWREPEWEWDGERYNSDGTVAENTGGMTHGEVWDKRLRENGALGWKDESCEIFMLPLGLWSNEWELE
jgi:hypothetical protein